MAWKLKHVLEHRILNPPLYVFGETSHIPEKKGENITPWSLHPPAPPCELFSNSAYSLFQNWKIYILFSCRQTRSSVPPFKLLYQSYKFNSLKMGCLVDPQGGPEEFCVLLFTKHPSWETAHLTSALLPKKGGNIFSTSQGAGSRQFKAMLGKERPPFGAEGVCSNMLTTAITTLYQSISCIYMWIYTQNFRNYEINQLQKMNGWYMWLQNSYYKAKNI